MNPLIPVVVALLGVVIAYASYRKGRRDERRAEQQEADRRPNLHLDLRSASYDFDSAGDLSWKVELSVTNRSDRPTSVSAAVLRAHYLAPSGHEQIAILGSEEGSDPTNLAARASELLCLDFRAPGAAFGRSAPSSYELLLSDAHGEDWSLDIGIANREDRS